ncbi:fatty acid desaturase [Streptomyces clavifer]|uniref:fatty acid desaturase n=1 Tax=Streptomyces clavifer TaxID=68188 RepID=UPI0037AB571F
MSDVRASYLRFPGWTQPFWTWATGRALPHQKPLIRHTWASYTAVTLVVFLGGLALSAAAVSARFDLWGLALVAGWVLTLQGARTMILVIAHQALHRKFSGNRARDRFFGELVTVLNVYNTFQEFKEEHFDNHHRRSVFATVEDPPVQFLFRFGFLPSMTRSQLWRRTLVVFVLPRFYAVTIGGRVRSNLTTGTWRRAGFVLWAGLWLSLPFWLPHGTSVLLLAFVLPVIFFSQLSALLDRLGEHAWLTPSDPGYDNRFYTVPATSARYCGAPVPERGLRLGRAAAAWAGWLLSFLFYHLPSRLMVIVGDLPNHDYHHRYPTTASWTTAAYARQRDIDSGDYGPPYTEVWGMFRAVDGMFRTMSEVPRDGDLVG